MEKEPLLMKLLEIAGDTVHHYLVEAEEDEIAPEMSVDIRKKKVKLSPIAQKILCLLLIEDGMNQRTIAGKAKVTGQAVSEMMRKLEGNGLVLRKLGGANNEIRISLTDRGREIAQIIQNKMEQLASILLSDFSQEDLDLLHVFLERMEKNHVKLREGKEEKINFNP